MKIIKYLLLCLTLVATHGYAQTKSAKKAKTKKANIISPPAIIIQEEYNETDLSFPQAFAWQINADTTLAPTVVFREVIEISGDHVDSRVSYKDVEVRIKKSEEKDANVEDRISSSIFTKLTQYDAVIDVDILKLIHKDSKAKRTFKIFYDENKKINSLQDLSTKKKYDLTRFKGAVPSI